VQACAALVQLTGSWRLKAWRRVAGDGTVSYPLGEDATGLLIYTPVQGPSGTVVNELAWAREHD
jgi:hypothetical protein